MIVQLLSFFVFLFTVYTLSADDFVLLRKNVSLQTIFDIVFVSAFIGLLISRIFFALFHLSTAFLNPLVFFLIPYFPGLSIAGFLLGGFSSVYGFSVRKKLPLGKIFDIFALSLLPAFALFYTVSGMQSFLHKHIVTGGIYAAVCILMVILFLFLRGLYAKAVWADGSIATWILSLTLVLISLLKVSLLSFRKIPEELPVYILLFFMVVVSIFIRNARKGRNDTS